MHAKVRCAREMQRHGAMLGAGLLLQH